MDEEEGTGRTGNPQLDEVLSVLDEDEEPGDEEEDEDGWAALHGGPPQRAAPANTSRPAPPAAPDSSNNNNNKQQTTNNTSKLPPRTPANTVDVAGEVSERAGPLLRATLRTQRSPAQGRTCDCRAPPAHATACLAQQPVPGPPVTPHASATSLLMSA
jgi:hypothetical protein